MIKEKKISCSDVMQHICENLDAELIDGNFEATSEKAKGLWNNYLGKIEIEAQSQTDATKFYSALYHT